MLPSKFTLLFLLLAVLKIDSCAQNSSPLKNKTKTTANDTVPSFKAPFGYGVNMGYFPLWKDKQLADIAIGNAVLQVAGIAANALRVALPEHFVEQYGYDIRISEFQHYKNIGSGHNTVFIGYPSPAHRDSTRYCTDHQNACFANLYENIWDNGENGTPINDNNYFAAYLYRLVKDYGEYVTFWEIWNEPDFDYTNHAWLPPGKDGSWWDVPPPPCQNALKAPIYHYIRMLRISYEIIKSMAPNDYVAIGGLGYPSFLDAVCRYTDNPDEGKVSKEYPLKGGAYFDCMSFHAYPHIDGSLRQWSNDIRGFVYERHSDKAIDGLRRLHGEFKAVLQKYGYGNSFPQKVFILTECNIPRKAFRDFIGSEEAQVNFTIKALVLAQQLGICQYDVYNLAESNSPEKANNEFELMGLYQNLNDTPPGEQKPTASGIAFETTASSLKETTYDAEQTKALLIPEGIRGAAFRHSDHDYTYVLWAKTSTDQSEETKPKKYAFPKDFDARRIFVKRWDYASTKKVDILNGNEITLDGSPVFFKINKE